MKCPNQALGFRKHLLFRASAVASNATVFRAKLRNLCLRSLWSEFQYDILCTNETTVKI